MIRLSNQLSTCNLRTAAPWWFVQGFLVGVVPAVLLWLAGCEPEQTVPPPGAPARLQKSVDAPAPAPEPRTDLDRLWRAVCIVESGGDPRAWNARERAAGIAQITPICLADCNRIVGHKRWTLDDRWSVSEARQMFELYLRFYAPSGPVERWARIWHGGPRGDSKTATEPYWAKVRRHL